MRDSQMGNALRLGEPSRKITMQDLIKLAETARPGIEPSRIKAFDAMLERMRNGLLPEKLVH